VLPNRFPTQSETANFMAKLNLLRYTLPELLLGLASCLMFMEDECATTEERDQMWDLMEEINRRREMEELRSAALPDIPRPLLNPPM
jgi:hypothetical protein